MREAALNPKRKSFASATRLTLRATITLFRFINRHQWFTSALILGGAVAILILWTLLLPLSEAHGAYAIQKSLRFNDDDSAYLNKTPGSSSSDPRTWTLSFWVKRGNLGSVQTLISAGSSDAVSPYETLFRFASDNTLGFIWNGNGGGVGDSWSTTAVFRDPAAWYHIVLKADIANTTRANRLTLYVNGQVVPFTASGSNANSGTTSWLNSSHVMRIGTQSWSAANYLDGYISDFYLVDGQQLGPENFAETDSTTGSWKAKAYSGTYGTNGFHLDFTDSGTLGNDISGNNNDWTSNNLDASDQMRDTPTNNYATLNSIDTNSAITLKNGNLSWTASNNRFTRGTIGVSSGKWYMEFTATGGGAGLSGVGLIRSRDNVYAADAFSGAGSYVGIGYLNNGQKSVSGTLTSFGATYTTGDLIGVAVDLDSGTQTVTFYKNNSSQGSINLPSSGETWSFVSDYSETGTHSLNFGQGGQSGLTYYAGAGGAFKYQPPAGFKALSTSNLPTPAIARPSDHFDAAIFTGTGGTRSTSGIRFSPDLVWIKGRSGATDHALYDSVRGAQDDLVTNSTAASTTQSTGLTAFNSDGFTTGALAKLNTSAATYVAWLWNEASTPGFDIVIGPYTMSVGHNLGVTPAFQIAKQTSASGNSWYVKHPALSTSEYLLLNTTGAKTDYGSQLWKTPSDTVAGMNDLSSSSGSGIIYLFAEVPGYSKFGTYTGNGSADGPFVYTGFKPRYILVKRTNGVENWYVMDSAREPNNPLSTVIEPNLTNGDGTSNTPVDFLSNGFKPRGTSTEANGSGDTYIYAAFAETPFKYATAGASLNAAYFIAWEF